MEAKKLGAAFLGGGAVLLITKFGVVPGFSADDSSSGWGIPVVMLIVGIYLVGKS